MPTIKNEYANASPKRKAGLNSATKRWRLKNPEKIAEIRARTDQKRKDTRRDKNLQKLYGITMDDYKSMLVEQNNVCAICFQPETLLGKGKYIRPLCVDHCHTTGKVRGLLCARCNMALGYMEDNEQRLLNAANYLRKTHARDIL